MKVCGLGNNIVMTDRQWSDGAVSGVTGLTDIWDTRCGWHPWWWWWHWGCQWWLQQDVWHLHATKGILKTRSPTKDNCRLIYVKPLGSILAAGVASRRIDGYEITLSWRCNRCRGLNLQIDPICHDLPFHRMSDLSDFEISGDDSDKCHKVPGHSLAGWE